MFLNRSIYYPYSGLEDLLRRILNQILTLVAQLLNIGIKVPLVLSSKTCLYHREYYSGEMIIFISYTMKDYNATGPDDVMLSAL